jgi:N-acetyl-alpha-D-glucosaminyl L-malate synthase BshA
MKIGIVCYPTYGGSGVVATELGMALANKGHEVHFITYNQPVRLDFMNKNIHFHEVFVEEYPLFIYQPYELALSSKMVEVVKQYNLQILHVHYAIPHAYAAYMAKQILKEKGINIKVVTTLHGTDITLVGSHPDYKTAVEFSINNSDAVTTVSQSLKNDTLRLFDIKKEIEVIYNFIDFDKYPDDQIDKYNRSNLAKENERIIVHISNFRPVKRIDDVVEIFNKIQQKIPAKLLMIGDGPLREGAEKLIKSYGIQDKVFFLGKTDDVNRLLCHADLFLLPSETESFGLAALEAMAAKTPVISSNAGGLSEVNIEGVTGYLSDVGNIEEMVANALKILKNDETMNLFKMKAYKHSLQFCQDNILPQYECVYRKLVHGCC